MAAVGYGVSDFMGGVLSRRIDALRVVIVSYPLSIPLVGALVPFAGGTVTRGSLIWAVVAGAASALAIWWYYLALVDGPMSVVSPVTAVLVAGIPAIVGFAAGERPGGLAVVGIGVALIAVLLVGREPPRPDAQTRFSPPVMLLTVGAGTAFAVYFVGLHQIDAGGGLVPLLVSRVAATVVIWTIAATRRTFDPPRGPALWATIVIAVLDVIANLAMYYAYQGGMLALVSVLGALYPAATVLLATVVLRERVSRLQQTGMVLALGSVALIVAG
ncbi:DMT family transporter [Skermania piniformis]|uniref:DMT family transporter n=1 Tax=Skermania pinensis TaxID=39122 RepID=UPI0009F9576B|nr:DMT family transporter [Skermania piniformis]